MDLTYVYTHSHHPDQDTEDLWGPADSLKPFSVNYCTFYPQGNHSLDFSHHRYIWGMHFQLT